MSNDQRSTTFKVPKGRSVRALLLWHDNYVTDTSARAVRAAKIKLDEYGLGFDILPSNGLKTSAHTITSAIGSDGLIGEAHYQALKDASESAYSTLDTAPNKKRVVVIFCEFKRAAKGVTVFESSAEPPEIGQCWTYPLCLVGSNLAIDNLTMLHEIGHASGLNDYSADAAGYVNFMNDQKDNRSVMYKMQLEKMAKSYYVL